MSDEENRRGFFASRASLVLLGFLAIGGFYLIAEHWAHLLGAAPLLLLLGFCFGMHFFMHRGHGGHGSDREDDNRPRTNRHGPGAHRH